MVIFFESSYHLRIWRILSWTTRRRFVPEIYARLNSSVASLNWTLFWQLRRFVFIVNPDINPNPCIVEKLSRKGNNSFWQIILKSVTTDLTFSRWVPPEKRGEPFEMIAARPFSSNLAKPWRWNRSWASPVPDRTKRPFDLLYSQRNYDLF